MNAEELADATMDVNARTLMKVEIDDTVMADDIFSMLMGEKVQPRKEFIKAHGHEVMTEETRRKEGRRQKDRGRDECGADVPQPRSAQTDA